MTLNPTTIALVEDHALVREGTRKILMAQADLKVVGEAARGQEAVRLVVELRVSSRTEAVVYAANHGIVSIEPAESR